MTRTKTKAPRAKRSPPVRMPMSRAKTLLAMVWFIGSGFPFLILIVQSFTNHYGRQLDQAWAWLLPSVLPTLSLIIGVLVADSQHDHRDAEVDVFLVRCAVGFSGAYLLVVLATILIQPAATGLPPLTLMHRAQLFLGPFQGLVTALLGAFFVKQAQRAKSTAGKTKD